MLRKNMLGGNDALFALEVLSLCDVEGCEVRKHQHAGCIEAKDYTGFLDVRDGDRIQAKANGLSSAEKPTEYALSIVSIGCIA